MPAAQGHVQQQHLPTLCVQAVYCLLQGAPGGAYLAKHARIHGLGCEASLSCDARPSIVHPYLSYLSYLYRPCSRSDSPTTALVWLRTWCSRLAPSLNHGKLLRAPGKRSCPDAAHIIALAFQGSRPSVYRRYLLRTFRWCSPGSPSIVDIA